MDAEIAGPGQRSDKIRSVKQDMMQQLATRAVRRPVPDESMGFDADDA
ncbi:MAG: hypothetical protein OXN89_18260 [Bryobacterales bacterium]|nr:hypothetical protein [Bryobacterales bacterium]